MFGLRKKGDFIKPPMQWLVNENNFFQVSRRFPCYFDSCNQEAVGEQTYKQLGHSNDLNIQSVQVIIMFHLFFHSKVNMFEPFASLDTTRNTHTHTQLNEQLNQIA